MIYASAFYEGSQNTNLELNIYSKIGFLLLLFSFISLFYVIYELREIWTVKLYISPTHKIVKSFLFRWFRHPNYFLNIIPEIFGITLLCNAWRTIMFLIPIYLIILSVRIYQEEKVMKGML